HEIANWLKVDIDAASASQACDNPTLRTMNSPYFAAEDKLMRVAAKSDGRWNAQLGFNYIDSPQRSSKSALAAVDNPSPFDGYLKDCVIQDVIDSGPSVVGFCIASTYQLIPTLQICKLLRSAGYQGFIVVGGNTVSRLRQEMTQPAVFDYLDALISFQGETPLLQLCRALESGHA